jgi:hypothetical protein
MALARLYGHTFRGDVLDYPTRTLDPVRREYLQASDDKRWFAFVLMPFRDDFTPIYTDLIVPPLQAEGFEVRRADTRPDQRNILRGIVEDIVSADLIVADLTTSNPNVFYEVGLAHALQKPTVLLTQNIGKLPFDLQSYTVIRYSRDFAQVQHLRDALGEIARSLKEASAVFSNPVNDFAPEVSARVQNVTTRE